MKRTSYELDGFAHGKNPIPAVGRIGNLVMTGGIYGLDLDAKKIPASFEEQCTNIFQLAGKILELAGVGLVDVIKVTVFLKPDIDREALNTVWLKHFPDERSRPVRHTIITPYLADSVLIQCEMMAVAS